LPYGRSIRKSILSVWSRRKMKFCRALSGDRRTVPLPKKTSSTASAKCPRKPYLQHPLTPAQLLNKHLKSRVPMQQHRKTHQFKPHLNRKTHLAYHTYFLYFYIRYQKGGIMPAKRLSQQQKERKIV